MTHKLSKVAAEKTFSPAYVTGTSVYVTGSPIYNLWFFKTSVWKEVRILTALFPY